MIYKRTVLSALLVALVAGCATPVTRIESNKAQDWSGQLRRIYVEQTEMKEWGQEFDGALEKRLTGVLEACGVASKVVHRRSLDLDTPEKRAAEAKQFGADSMLAVRPTGGGSNYNGATVNRIFAADLTVAPSRTVWRANFVVFRGGTAVEKLSERGDAFAIELTNRMKADGLLGSCAQLPVPKRGI